VIEGSGFGAGRGRVPSSLNSRSRCVSCIFRKAAPGRGSAYFGADRDLRMYRSCFGLSPPLSERTARFLSDPIKGDCAMCVPGTFEARYRRDCSGCPCWISGRDLAGIHWSLAKYSVASCNCRIYAVTTDEIQGDVWVVRPRGYVLAPSLTLAIEYVEDSLRRHRSGINVVPVLSPASPRL
jgi:hypothetical protein